MDPSLHDELTVGLLRLDTALEIREVSPRFSAQFGCEPDALLGVELSELVASKDRRTIILLDRRLSDPSTQHIDTVAALEVGERECLARLQLSRADSGWLVLVETLDAEENIIRELYTRQNRWARAIKESTQGFLFVDQQLRVLEYNARFIEFVGLRSSHGVQLTGSALAGRPLRELLELDASSASLLAALGEMWGSEVRCSQLELRERLFELEVRPLYVPLGGLAGYSISLRDLTDQRNAERERHARQQEQLRHHSEVIAAQRDAIRSLSAPRIPLSSELTVVPLIGELDAPRITEIREELLDAVSHSQTRVLIIDITGVPQLDAPSVDALVDTALALRLLGVRALLTGARPTIAKALANGRFAADTLEFHRNVRAALAATLRA